MASLLKQPISETWLVRLRRIAYHSRKTRVSTPKIEQAVVNAAMISDQHGSLSARQVGPGRTLKAIQPDPHTPALCVCV